MHSLKLGDTKMVKIILLVMVLMLNLFSTNITIKDKGRLETLDVVTNGVLSEVKYRYGIYKFYNNSSVLVKFNEITPELISSFEEKFGLKLVQILVVGYYVYQFDGDINEKVSLISKEENVLSVKPNWSLKPNKY